MMPFDEMVLRFLLASGGCMAAGLAVWALTSAFRRYLPIFSQQRSIWLLAQATVLATFLLILLPHSERLRLIPPIELPETTVTSLAVPDLAAAFAPASTNAGPATAPVERSWLGIGAQAWLLVYLLGFAYTVGALLQAHRILFGLATSGSRLQHDSCAASIPCSPALSVIEVDAPISPMLFGLLRPRLLLPRHLRSFEPAQQQLIIEHELTHLRRRDLHWMGLGILLQTLLWFNPFMRLLRAHLSWAQELGCDRDVLQGRAPAERKAYAAALVAQLKLQNRQMNTALAFGGVSSSTVAARIALIRQPVTGAGRLWTRCVAFLALIGVGVASLAFQPALAERIKPRSQAKQAAMDTPFSCTEMVDASSGKQLAREGHCDERVTPASTFNLAVSLMGYDSEILADEHSPKLPFKQGYADWNPIWRADTDPTNWLKNSVVWYAQQVTSRLGPERFQGYINSFNYGNRDVSGDAGKNNGLAMSWISSSLKISPVEQAAFLRKVVNRDLPLTDKAYDMTSRISLVGTLPNGWEVHGKTGTASPVLADGRDDEKQVYGWFVGWAIKGERKVVFARLVLEPRQPQDSAGSRTKQAFLRDLPARLDTL